MRMNECEIVVYNKPVDFEILGKFDLPPHATNILVAFNHVFTVDLRPLNVLASSHLLLALWVEASTPAL